MALAMFSTAMRMQPAASCGLLPLAGIEAASAANLSAHDVGIDGLMAAGAEHRGKEIRLNAA